MLYVRLGEGLSSRTLYFKLSTILSMASVCWLGSSGCTGACIRGFFTSGEGSGDSSLLTERIYWTLVLGAGFSTETTSAVGVFSDRSLNVLVLRFLGLFLAVAGSLMALRVVFLAPLALIVWASDLCSRFEACE